MSERTARKLDRELAAKLKRLQRGETEKPKTLEERARELDRAHLDRIASGLSLDTRAKRFARQGDTKLRCPLCRNRFEKMVDLGTVPPRELYVCHADKIGIDTRDPFVGNWEVPGSKPIPCPRCESPMRFFCTSTGYWRAVCYGTLTTTNKGKRMCGAILAAAQPDRKGDAAKVDIGTIDRPVEKKDIILPTTDIEGNA